MKFASSRNEFELISSRIGKVIPHIPLKQIKTYIICKILPLRKIGLPKHLEPRLK